MGLKQPAQSLARSPAPCMVAVTVNLATPAGWGPPVSGQVLAAFRAQTSSPDLFWAWREVRVSSLLSPNPSPPHTPVLEA